MTCERAEELIAASWLRELSAPDEASLRQHLDECIACKTEHTALGAIWQRLGDVPVPDPSRTLDVRWQETLASFVAKDGTYRWSLANLWPRSFAGQIAVAAACLTLGLAAGMFVPRHEGEIAQLQREVKATRAMVALSLLQQQSATERLRGIDYSGRMPQLEPEVVTALIEAVNHDSSVNVRLGAIDALGKAAGSRDVLASLTRSLAEQDSPMVQAALIDYLMDARDRNAIEALERLERHPNLNPSVLERAHLAVRELSKD